MSQLKPNKSHIILSGDFNIDLLKTDSHEPTKRNVDIMLSHGMIPRISSPTRITHHSATNIDNIFSNNLLNPITSGIIINDMSDHLPNYIIIDYELSRARPKQTKIKCFSIRNLERFTNHINSIDWTPYLNELSPITLNDLADVQSNDIIHIFY